MAQYHSLGMGSSKCQPLQIYGPIWQAEEKRERKDGKLINLCLYSDWWCLVTLYKISKRDRKIANKNSIQLNKFLSCSIKLFDYFFDVNDECFHFPLAWTISSDILAHPWFMITCESTQTGDWYANGRLQCFYLLGVNLSFRCCIQRHASCCNLLTVLVKLLSQLLADWDELSVIMAIMQPLWLCSYTSSSWPVWSCSM